MLQGCFITGTDTGIGKTYFTALWTRALRARGVKALALKPFLCGERTDAEELFHANEQELSIDQVNPVWLFPPLSPYAACLIEDKLLDWDAARAGWHNVQQHSIGPFLVEGVGGWLVPLDQQHTVRDWAVELGLPVVIVCRAGLGTINHTLLTVESVRATGLKILGIVMNFHQSPEDLATQTNPGIIEQLTGLSVFKLEEGAKKIHLPNWLSSF